MGEKGESFTGTSIKDTWTTTREGGNRGGRWGGLVGEGSGERQKTVREQ